jgi:CheY-like chemotaxis protein/HPt (histidine-containing phosphotransfer) domain-containing protein
MAGNPVDLAADAVHDPARAAPAPVEGPLVLAVDDHPSNRELLRRQLEALGLATRTAASGQEALALWRDAAFALIISDCNMPEMGGQALSRAIRAIEAREDRPRTPIIALTGDSLPDALTQCQAAGMDDTLTKPTALADLREALSKWLPIAAGPGRRHGAPLDLTELGAENAADRAEILGDFREQARSDRAALDTALAEQDGEACVRIAHRMKGASLMVGASELADACSATENAARRDGATGASATKAALDRALTRLEARVAEETDATAKREAARP